MTPEKVYRAARAQRRPVRRRDGRHRPARRDHRRLRRPEDARRDRAEYRKGRLLLIGTTDLDAQRPVIWNIGAIAASGHPGALELFRKILRASAAIPGAFQPVLIDVELDGKKYQEMHVDGGAIAQLFLYPPSIDISASGVRRAAARLHHPQRPSRSGLCGERAAHHLDRRPRHQHHAGGQRLATTCCAPTSSPSATSVDYNLAYIGRDFVAPKAGEFDQAYMRALYAYGERQAMDGQSWHRTPPVLELRDTGKP